MLTDFHAYEKSVKWRVMAHGVELEDGHIPRTSGKPVTVQKIWASYRPMIEAAADARGVPCELIIACIAVESAGNASAIRKEPGYKSDNETPHRISVGLMQPLISTARDALKNRTIDRNDLLNPRTNIGAGVAYMAQQSKATELDPPKVAAAYNAGGIYLDSSAANKWKMRCYPIGTGGHIDKFVAWYNDAVEMLAEAKTVPKTSYAAIFAGKTEEITTVPVAEAEPEPATKPSLWAWIASWFA